MTYDDVFAPNYIGYGLDGSGALDSLGLFAWHSLSKLLVWFYASNLGVHPCEIKLISTEFVTTIITQ